MRRVIRAFGAAALSLTVALALVLPLAHAQLQVTVQLENDTFVHPTDAATLADFFAELGLTLPDDYISELHLNLNAKPPEILRLPRLAIARVEQRETISPPLKYVTVPTQSMPRMAVEKPGAPGEKLVTAAFFFLAGELVGERHRSEIIREPKPRVFAVYTAVEESYVPSVEEILRLDKLSSREFKPPVRYKRKVVMEATAFDPTVGGSDPSACTASGLRAKYGVVAVDPDTIPLGTRLFIEGYGYAVAGDVGGAIKGNKIDLCFSTIKECYEFGRRSVVVYILD